MRSLFIAATALALAAGPAQAQEIVRKGAASAAISTSVALPAGSTLVYVSGLTPDPIPGMAENDPSRFGDTETQTRSVLKKINDALAEHGMGPGDVVMMRVLLVGVPGPGGGKMDFAGMMKAYRQVYGTPQQPKKPARITSQVVALANPAFLVEIEATAAKAPARPARK
ncbi:Rid family hydrolase [Sphingomonas immobilis]|uniref:Rid family hydrolase n=1 Tax=Sphingomonas immobilis TaxID=3063997 RepID=A0ABT9A3G4_9SPHN|nr:Rid family hydrolase [Sphingomonas sp. CA1-15]MDO7843277.1 Rid family hydrolase [Sphingomonas sp. CA1-15]